MEWAYGRMTKARVIRCKLRQSAYNLLTTVRKREFWQVQLEMERLKKLHLPKFPQLYNG